MLIYLMNYKTLKNKIRVWLNVDNKSILKIHVSSINDCAINDRVNIIYKNHKFEVIKI